MTASRQVLPRINKPFLQDQTVPFSFRRAKTQLLVATLSRTCRSQASSHHSDLAPILVHRNKPGRVLTMFCRCQKSRQGREIWNLKTHSPKSTTRRTVPTSKSFHGGCICIPATHVWVIGCVHGFKTHSSVSPLLFGYVLLYCRGGCCSCSCCCNVQSSSKVVKVTRY